MALISWLNRGGGEKVLTDKSCPISNLYLCYVQHYCWFLFLLSPVLLENLSRYKNGSSWSELVPTNKSFKSKIWLLQGLNSLHVKIEPRMQSCRQNPRIACSTKHVSNTWYRWYKFKKETTFKNLCTIRDPSIPLSGRSYLVRWYLYQIQRIWYSTVAFENSVYDHSWSVSTVFAKFFSVNR